MLSRETIEELNNLSMTVFRSKSKWRKMMDPGVAELITEDTTRLSHDGAKETVKTPKMHEGPNGGELPQYVLKRYTAESVKEFMLSVLIERQRRLTAMQMAEDNKKAQEELALKKELVQQAVEEASGTSI